MIKPTAPTPCRCKRVEADCDQLRVPDGMPVATPSPPILPATATHRMYPGMYPPARKTPTWSASSRRGRSCRSISRPRSWRWWRRPAESGSRGPFSLLWRGGRSESGHVVLPLALGGRPVPIPVVCPQCQRRVRVPAKLAGRRVLCPGCNGRIEVPAASTVAQPPPRRPTRRRTLRPPRRPARRFPASPRHTRRCGAF